MQEQIKEQALFEQKPIIEAVVRLALPTVVGQIILVIYNMADTFFVGLTGNDAMVAAVTLCMPGFMFLSAISNLFGIGGASVISRALGARQMEKARDTASFAFWGCLATSLTYALCVGLMMDGFIDVLGGSNPAVHAHARSYFTVTVGWGGCFAAMSTFFSHLVRSEGRSIHASLGVAIGGVLNIVLDPLFMFVLLPDGHAVLGAALATAVSNVVSVLYFIVIFTRKSDRFIRSFHFTKSMFSQGIPAAVFSCGLPACLMTLCENISYAVLDNLMALNGIAMQAGLGVAKKINMLAHCSVRGMSQGVMPLISYNYAAKNDRRMKGALSVSMCISIALSTVCMIVCLVFNEALVGLFIRNQTDSVDYGAAFLRILCIGAPFSACAYAVISFFQAVGCGFKSFILAILRKGVVDIPMMFLLNALYPVYGIVWATPVVDMLCSMAAAYLLCAFMKRQNLDIEKSA